jgi:hypothetical protein
MHGATIKKVTFMSISTRVVYVKVKVTAEQATKAHMGSRGIAQLFL